jgi:sec-independent protein translocase protein TatC
MVIGPQHTGNSNYGFCHVFFLAITCLTLLLFGPYGQHLQLLFFCDLSQSLGLTDSFCITEFPFIIQNTSMEGQVNVFIWVCSCRIYFKFSLYFMGNMEFISPAFTRMKRKCKGIHLFLRYFLYWVLGYYIVIPCQLTLLLPLVSDLVLNQFTLDSYIGLVKRPFWQVYFWITNYYLFLELGLVTPAFLRTYRKYAIVLVLVVAAIVTPPDVVSQTIVAIPMLLIYEASILFQYL